MSSPDKPLGSEAAKKKATSPNSKIDSATSAFQRQSQSGNSESSQSISSSSSESFTSAFLDDYVADEVICNVLDQQLVEMNKATLKRKPDEECSKLLVSINEGNRQLLEILEKRSAYRRQDYEIQSKKLDIAEYRQESNLLLKDLNSISDLNVREFFRREQLRIMEKRAQQQRPGSQNTIHS
ncbi:hypothetical protein Dsin_023245 [Dipteronia sinensis]|uniref:Uncharacterized protein n=1 Tax=Dipteronia sinensis TaxID=43782 RepID=A0AAE0A306_9ROSI|nr:hypothetical protein Dsin_023245 [Dipteronia sinensis]